MPSCTGTSRSSPCRAIPSPVCEDDGIAFCQVFVNEAELERELQLIHVFCSWTGLVPIPLRLGTRLALHMRTVSTSGGVEPQGEATTDLAS